MTFRNKCRYIFIVTAFVFLFIGVSAADEKWRIITWDITGTFMAEFDAMCLESGLTSFDVLEANGYPGSGKRPPAKGSELLVPTSKENLFAAWMEIQDRNGGARPLVTIKPHNIPGITRVSADISEQAEETPEESPEPELEDTAVPSEPDSMQIVVSGDEIVIRRPNGIRSRVISSILDPALASRDVIIPDPPVLKPMIGRPAVTQGKMMWPVSGKVSSGFGRRGRRNHAGIDLPMPNGTPIAAALDGVVIETGTNRDRNFRGYGNTVVLDHGNGLVTMYAHCSKLNVREGQRVRQGEIVGFVGNTGRTTTHHVHFEVRQNGKAVNPIPYLAAR